MTIPLPIRVVAPVLAGAVLLAACGGSTSDSASVGQPDDERVVTEVVDDVAGSGEDEQAVGTAASEALTPSGTFTMEIEGETYEASSTECQGFRTDKFGDVNDFYWIGSGTVAGNSIWVKVIRAVPIFNGDGVDNMVNIIDVEVGGEPGHQAPKGMPSLLIQIFEGEEENSKGSLSVDYEVGRLSGSGGILDRNEVLAPADVAIPFTFVATCD